jgi:hypothetical protein
MSRSGSWTLSDGGFNGGIRRPEAQSNKTDQDQLTGSAFPTPFWHHLNWDQIAWEDSTLQVTLFNQRLNTEEFSLRSHTQLLFFRG